MSKNKQMDIIEETEGKTFPSDKQKNNKLGAHIMASLDMENNFKLYSYRIISEDVFIERNEIIMNDLKNLK